MMIKYSYPTLILLLLVAVSFSFCLKAQTTQPQPAVYNQKLQSSSLLFMENKGQVADAKGRLQPDILFTANSNGAKLYLSANAIHYQFTKTEYPNGYDLHRKEPSNNPKKEADLQKQIKTRTHRFSLELQGANRHPIVSTEKQSEYTENYYLAHCPDGITDVHGYEKIIYKNVYPNIDWVIYSKGGFMEYDFLVHPGADVAAIKLNVKDAESIGINKAGDLVMKTSLGEVREKAPVSYADGALIETHFKQLGDGTIGFEVQPQPGKELRIDPSVVWATYYGGSSVEDGLACALDSNNNVYLTGYTNSATGISSGGQQNAFGGVRDAVLVKFDNAGNRIWATYYGGTNYDFAFFCAVDKSGNVFISGITESASGIASGGFQNVFGGNSDAFLVKFGNNGVRRWATYYGSNGYDYGLCCATDLNGNVYLGGETTSTSGIASGGFQNVYAGFEGDAFLVKFDSSGNRQWGTYYGGSRDDVGHSCITDNNGNVYLAGSTNSTTAIASGGHQNTFGGGFPLDAFLVKFSSTGARIWGTYYGANDIEEGLACAIDNIGNVYLAGNTYSGSSIASGGFQNTYAGGFDAFLVKFNSSGVRQWATYYGGNGSEFGNACAVDNNGNVYLAGETSSRSGISFYGFQNTYTGGNADGFLAKFNTTGERIWATYFGGASGDVLRFCTVDRNSNLFLSGYTNSTSGIAINGFQNNISGGSDAILVKVNSNAGINTLCPNSSYSFASNITGISYQWQVNTGSGFFDLNNNVNYSGTNTPALQLISLPSAFYGYQYRCIIDGNMSDVFQLSFIHSWKGSVNSAWENPANWSCGVIPDGNTDVIINTGPVTLNSNGICRTLTIRPGVSFTVATGNTLTITH